MQRSLWNRSGEWPGGFRLFGFEPLIGIGARRCDRHCFLVGILENLSEGARTCCALFLRCTATSKVSATRWACFRSLSRVDLTTKRPSLSRKKACQYFEAGLLSALAIKCLIRADKEQIEARTANIHVFPLISAFFSSVDFEAFTIQADPQYPLC